MFIIFLVLVVLSFTICVALLISERNNKKINNVLHDDVDDLFEEDKYDDEII